MNGETKSSESGSLSFPVRGVWSDERWPHQKSDIGSFRVFFCTGEHYRKRDQTE